MASIINKKSGSIAYNRLDMQISQVLHLAIELYDSLDFLLVIDHFDDITLFDDQNCAGIVSYYQMKTSDTIITLNMALSERWIDKLYAHLAEPDVFVKELGLITNCNIHMLNHQILYAEKTPFNQLNLESISKIREDIALRNGIDINTVDLNKFVHLRTTLSIDRHKDIVEKETSDFLFVKYPNIKMQTAKTVFSSVIALLTQQQSCERLADECNFMDVKNRKGFSRSLFDQIIKTAIKINIPEYDKLRDFAKIADDKIELAALAYTQILSDNNSNTDSFLKTFEEIDDIILNNTIENGESVWSYTQKCKTLFSNKIPRSILLYANSLYIDVLIICILMNQ